MRLVINIIIDLVWIVHHVIVTTSDSVFVPTSEVIVFGIIELKKSISGQCAS